MVLLTLGLCVLLALAAVGVGLGYAEHAAVQSAVDAAALACAGQIATVRQVDARGTVYLETVTVRPSAGLDAATVAWTANMIALPVGLLAFSASAQGATCTVAVTVRSLIPSLLILKRFAVVWSASAEARSIPASPS